MNNLERGLNLSSEFVPNLHYWLEIDLGVDYLGGCGEMAVESCNCCVVEAESLDWNFEKCFEFDFAEIVGKFVGRVVGI